METSMTSAILETMLPKKVIDLCLQAVKWADSGIAESPEFGAVNQLVANQIITAINGPSTKEYRISDRPLSSMNNGGNGTRVMLRNSIQKLYRSEGKLEAFKKPGKAKKAKATKTQAPAPAIQEDVLLAKVQAIVEQSQANLLQMMLDNGMVKKPRASKVKS